MTQTGWIVVGIIAIVAIILVALVLRRKPAGALPGEEAETRLPEQVTPEPLLAPRPVAAEAPPPAPVAPIAPLVTEPPARPVEAEPLAPAPVAVAQEAPLPEPVAISEPAAAAPPAPGEGDDLLKLKGVGPKIATLLRAEGVTSFAQIAAWTDADLTALDLKLGSFAGRPRRDNWVDQAALLAAGDMAGYEAKYGKL
ncbi:MAG: hypothetical protein QM690_05870 [Sphingobium sp.]